MEDTQAFKFAKAPIVDYIRIKASSTDSYIDITALVEQFNIYEDITSPFIFGDITIIDGLSLITKLPFTGKEFVEISYRSSFLEETQLLKFECYRLSNVQENGADNSQMYTLYFSTSEFIQNHRNKILMSYDDRHDNIIRKIFDNYLKVGDSTLTIPEPCEDYETIVIPNKTPVGAINQIIRRSRCSKNIEECSYIFYSRMGEGFFLTTLGYLSEKQEKFKYSRTYTDYVTSTNDKNILKPIFTIDTFVIENALNTIESMGTGRHISSLNTLDPHTRSYDSRVYDISTEFDKTRHVEKYIPGDQNMLSGSIDANLTYHPIMENRNEGHIDYTSDIYLKRNAQLSQFDSHRVVISVPGNSDLHAGDVIRIEIPGKDAPREGKKEFDERNSGRYLVRSVRHQIAKNQEYMSYVVLIRDSVSVKYTDVSNSTQTIIDSQFNI